MAFAYWNDWMASFLYIDSDNKIMLQYLLVRVMKNLQFLNSPEAMRYGIPSQDIPTYSARMAMCVIASGPNTTCIPILSKILCERTYIRFCERINQVIRHYVP